MSSAKKGSLLRVKMLINLILNYKIVKLDLIIISRRAIGRKTNNLSRKSEINTNSLDKLKLIIIMEPVKKQ